MLMSFFLQGLLIGLAIAIPVGPIGVLCIRRTLAMGQWVGLFSGLGAATADGLYGCIAGFGLTAISDLLIQQAVWLRIVGGLFLCYLGITTIFAKPAASLKAADEATETPDTDVASTREASVGRSLLSAYGSTLALTLTNPATIFSFIAVFAGLGIVEAGRDYATSGVLVGGVFLGSALWWFFLSGTVNLFRTFLTPTRMRWLNRISGLVILTFGIIALTLRQG
ncbi:MAG: LysE family transporter [Cyanobacteria bacterium J06638_20]